MFLRFYSVALGNALKGHFSCYCWKHVFFFQKLIFPHLTFKISDQALECPLMSGSPPVWFIIRRISSTPELQSWTLFPTPLHSLQGNASLHGLDWIFIKTLLISDDTRACACPRHMHKMCIYMVLFLSRWCQSGCSWDTLWNPSLGAAIILHVIYQSLFEDHFATCMIDSDPKVIWCGLDSRHGIFLLVCEHKNWQMPWKNIATVFFFLICSL